MSDGVNNPWLPEAAMAFLAMTLWHLIASTRDRMARLSEIVINKLKAKHITFALHITSSSISLIIHATAATEAGISQHMPSEIINNYGDGSPMK